MKKLKTVWLQALMAAVILWLPASLHAGTSVIKIALVTPEGSAWTLALRQMADEVHKRTGGNVRFKIYPGGISGDELDVLRKMRVNRIQAAGLSGVGLGVILPKIRILEAPLLYRNYIEVDRVKEALFDEFAADFDKQGYVLLGFAEAGDVYFFAQRDISTPAGLKTVKMWSWKGDPVARVFLETFGIKTVPLHVADVNTGLETGMIDAFYSPPLAAIAFQWHTKVGYLLDYPMANSTGALVIRKAAFNRLSNDHQAVLKSAADKYCRRLVEISRRENAVAMEVLKESGIDLIAPSDLQIRTFQENAEKTYEKNIPALYSKDLLDRVRGIVSASRSGN